MAPKGLELFTREEVAGLCLAAERGSGRELTDEEFDRILARCVRTRAEVAAIGMAIAGELDLTLVNGDLVWFFTKRNTPPD